MVERILIAGSGGQGIILIGKLLASVAVNRVAHVTFFPAYGAEVRGGTSNCQVILSTKEISSPVSERFGSVIIMNQASADRFLPRMADNCLAVLNSSMCKAPTSVASPVMIKATELANEFGDTRAANFIMLGAFLARKQVVPTADIEQEIVQAFTDKSRKLIDLNMKAFRAGLKQ